MPCFNTVRGHAVHYLQLRHHKDFGPFQTVHVEHVEDDGHITLSNGSVQWNHDPARISATIAPEEVCGLYEDAHLLVSEHGAFSLDSGPSPCVNTPA